MMKPTIIYVGTGGIGGGSASGGGAASASMDGTVVIHHGGGGGYIAVASEEAQRREAERRARIRPYTGCENELLREATRTFLRGFWCADSLWKPTATTDSHAEIYDTLMGYEGAMAEAVNYTLRQAAEKLEAAGDIEAAAEVRMMMLKENEG